MRRYTTPTITLKVVGVDLTGSNVYVTFKQEDSTLITKSGDDVTAELDGSDTTITVSLTQAETGSLMAQKSTSVQVNWMSGATRKATEIRYISTTENLLEGVLS
jgi:hypothetical protein